MLQTKENELELFQTILADEEAFIQTFFDIPPKEAEAKRTKFVLWPPQLKVLKAMRESRRVLVLKDSQIGCTSVITAAFTKRTITTDDTTTVIVAHESFVTERLLNRAQVFIDSAPDFIKPKQAHESTYEKSFPDINSVMYIGTARAAVFGRGEPIHNLLFSEIAHYPSEALKKIVTPAMQRVPFSGTVVWESTPNGEDEILFPEVEKYLRHESNFELVVLYWWENPSNTLPSDDTTAKALNLPEEDRGEFELTSDEKALKEQNGLSFDQIRWRRYKIRESGDLFWQEHMEDLDTCFLLVGEARYSANEISRLKKLISPPEIKELSAPYTGRTFKMWYPPEDGGIYLMGVDPGQGKVTESVAIILRWFAGEDEDTFRHEATLSGWYTADEFWEMCKQVTKIYHTPLLNPEANSDGWGFIHYAKNYPRLYWRKDIISGVPIRQIGWNTNRSTKTFMINEIERTLPRFTTHDKELIHQLSSCRNLGNGKVHFNSLDDHHDGFGLALVSVLGTNPRTKRGFVGGSGHTSWDERN